MSMKEKIPVIAIVGPTASGKTGLAVSVAERFGGEVISADSMQIYSELEIGTAKPTEKEMCGVPHHMVGFLSIDKDYSVANYVADAAEKIKEVRGRKKLPIICGGTGLYIDSLLTNTEFSDIESDLSIRQELYDFANEHGKEKLYEELEHKDPESAAMIHPNNLGRVVRALEVLKITGIPLCEHKRRSHAAPSPYNVCYIGTGFENRELLYQRIEARIDEMLTEGLIDEARFLFEHESVSTAAQAIGYKEFYPYFCGKATFEEAVSQLKSDTRHYAKRQLTWFRRNKNINWFYNDCYESKKELYQAVFEKISEFLEENIAQMVRVINISYKISKSNFVWQKRFEENKKNIETQLQGVSKAISNIAENIEKNIKNEEQYNNEKKQVVELLKQKEIEIQEISIQKEDRFLIEVYMQKSNNTDIEYIEKILTEVLKEKIVFNQEASIGTRLNFLSDDKFVMALGNADTTKSNSDISGDSLLSIRLKDGKYLVALSDGMGSGNDAKQSSNKALKMLENLLLSGFDKKTSLELINSSLINQNEEIFATLDIAIIDLYAGNIEFIKSGACPTYIKNKNKVQIIKANSLPAGIINDANLQSFDRDISEGEIMLMCTDGILDSNVEYKNKELWIKYLLEDIETTNTKKIADLVLNEAIDNNYGVAKDDMSVVVCKFLNK